MMWISNAYCFYMVYLLIIITLYLYTHTCTMYINELLHFMTNYYVKKSIKIEKQKKTERKREN